MTRNIYIKKAEIVHHYYIGEYIGKDNIWKEQAIFQSTQDLVSYLRSSSEEYAVELRKRRNLGIIVNLSNEEGDSLVQALNEIKNRFNKVFIRRAPLNTHH